MTDYSDQDIVAFIDGQMDAKARAAFDAQLQGDAELERRVAAHGWIVRQIVAAYGKPPEGAVDSALLERLGLDRGNVVPIRRAALKMQPVWARWAAGITAVAASLAIGFFVGHLTGGVDTGILAQSDGGLIAKGELDQTLSNKLSGDKGQIQISMTFKTAGGVCRTFKSSSGMSGIGCQDGKQWTIPILVRSSSRQPSGMDYQLASGDIAPAVMAEVDRSIVGEPLNPAQEREALKRR